MHGAGHNQEQFIRMQKKTHAAGMVLTDPAPYKDQLIVRMGVCNRRAHLDVDIVAHRNEVSIKLKICHVLGQVLIHDRLYMMISNSSSLPFLCTAKFLMGTSFH